MLYWIGLSVIIIAIDQGTKWWAETNLILHQPIEITRFFNITLMYNKGAAFSIFSEQSGWQRWFLSGLALAISVLLIYWLYKLPNKEKLTALAFACILGGALGNLIDRLYYGHVIDFIQLHYEKWYWPTFNIADSAITLGVGVMLLNAWLEFKTNSFPNQL